MIVVVVVVVVGGAATANPEGQAGRALVEYHPGITAFPRDVTMAFVDALVADDWQVATTTASQEAPCGVAMRRRASDAVAA